MVTQVFLTETVTRILLTEDVSGVMAPDIETHFQATSGKEKPRSEILDTVRHCHPPGECGAGVFAAVPAPVTSIGSRYCALYSVCHSDGYLKAK
jgi:hypothetical protein